MPSIIGQPLFGDRSSLIDNSIDCLVRELPPPVVIRSQKDCNKGEIVAAMIDGEATVKTFSRKDCQIWQLPANDNFTPIDGNNCEILVKVTAAMRSIS